MVEGLPMIGVAEALARFRRDPDVRSAQNPFTLRSSLAEPAASREIALSWGPREIPADAHALWAHAREARLCEDVNYGQWGLHLFDPKASAIRTERERVSRPSEILDDDIVVGEFLGDQELLVLAPSEQGTRRVLIELPLDPRHEWFGAARGLAEFLDAYFDARGDKFWERR